MPFDLHRRIPYVRRPFHQRDLAIAERDALATKLRNVAPAARAPLFAIAERSYSADIGTKHPLYYRRYDDFFRSGGFTPTAILEIGVHRGESTKVFAEAYPKAKILALDLKRYDDVDFSTFPQVSYEQCDQTDAAALRAAIGHKFPSGFDLVVDDASHIGAYSRATFDVVFPLLQPGGIYIVEDWGTGYFDDFVDGSRFQEYPLTFHDGNIPKRIHSHDFGMVGFVKSLVDMTAGPDIRANMADPPRHTVAIERLEFGPATCIALKARPAPPAAG